jgi:cytochrome c oxidase accessory protein FixG
LTVITSDADQPRPPSRQTTIGERGKRRWIYADLARGRFARARNVVSSLLIVFYVLAPWLSIAGQPFLRFDIPARRYGIFGATFVATDLFLLALFLIIAVVGLFLFSALLGRLWCGWACPQTVYLEGVFRRIERWIEGTPLKRRKLDSGPRDGAYWLKKITKHGVFIAISVFLSLSFIAYFIGPRAAFGMLWTGGGGHPAAMVTAFILSIATYWDFAWFREQFCTFLCPYARLQSVMLDEHSLIVGYDPERGEPRGAHQPGSSWEGRGDCIDCKRCVQVCPTGIDIRHGLQLECVSCTACIDACDTVMERIGRPRGLIRYDSLAGLARHPKKVIRSRVVLYSVVMLALLSVFAVRLIGREVIELSVTRAPGVPYLVQDDGRVRNLFVVHVTNTDARERTVSVEVTGPDNLSVIVPDQPFHLASGGHRSSEVFVTLPAAQIMSAEIPLHFRVVADFETVSEARAVFLGPLHR